MSEFKKKKPEHLHPNKNYIKPLYYVYRVYNFATIKGKVPAKENYFQSEGPTQLDFKKVFFLQFILNFWSLSLQNNFATIGGIHSVD